MADIISQLMKYKSIDLVSYLNKTFPEYEKSVMLMEKDKVDRINSDLETEIFKVFLQNSDSLLDILDTYENVYIKLLEMKDLIYFTNIEEEKEIYIDKKKLNNFRGIIKRFTTDLSSFDTGERILEHFEFLGSYIFVMTNDILILGKKSNNRYSLINTFNYSIIKMEYQNKLLLRVGNTKMSFEGDKQKITKIIEKYKELSYKYEDTVSTEDYTEKNDDLNEYYFETEKYDLFDSIFFTTRNPNTEYKEDDSVRSQNTSSSVDYKYKHEDNFSLDTKNRIEFYDLETLKNCTKNNNQILINFLKYKFNDLLKNINKIKTLTSLIEDTLDFLYIFTKEEKLICKDCELEYVLLLEDHVLESIKYFERRIINRKLYNNTLDEILELIKKKLLFNNYDYSYMIEYLIDKLQEHSGPFIDEAKRKITEMIEDFVR